MANSTFYWRGFATTTFRVNEALISILNTGTNKSTITIEDYDIIPVNQCGTLGEQNYYINLCRISSRIDGAVTLTPRSSNPSISLPSQVKCETHSLVTLTSPQPSRFAFRTIVGQDTGNLNPSQWVFGYNTGKTNTLGPRGGFGIYNSPITQGIVIREGEGFALCRIGDTAADITSRPFVWMGYIVFSDDLGNSFSTMFDMSTTEAVTQAAFSLFNGGGSGRTYTVLHMEITPLASNHNNTNQMLNIKAFSTSGDKGGEIITPTAMVPGTSLPSFVSMKRSRMGYTLDFIRNLDPQIVRFWNLDNANFQSLGSVTPYGEPQRCSGLLHPMSPAGRINGGLGAAGWQHHNNLSRFGKRNKSNNVQPFTITSGNGFAMVPDNLMYGGILTAVEAQRDFHGYWIELIISVNTGTTAIAHS